MRTILLTSILFLNFLAGSIAQDPPNNTCETATLIKCDTILTEQWIRLTLPGSADEGDDPERSLREDVWYKLVIDQAPVLVEIRVVATDGMKMSIGLYRDAADNCQNLVKMGWKSDGHVLRRCLANGTYKIVIDEARAEGVNKPNSDEFFIEIFCTPWLVGMENVSYTVTDCVVDLYGDQFIPDVIWDTYLVQAELFPEMEIPDRVPGTATFVASDAEGVLNFSDLEFRADDNYQPSSSAPAALIGDPVENGVYYLVVDDGDGWYIPGWDYQLGPIEVEDCMFSSTEMLDAFLPDLQLRTNPVREEAALSVRLPNGGQLTLQVYDGQGQMVAEPFVRQALTAGVHELSWSTETKEGVFLPGGLYYVQARFTSAKGNFNLPLQKLVIMR